MVGFWTHMLDGRMMLAHKCSCDDVAYSTCFSKGEPCAKNCDGCYPARSIYACGRLVPARCLLETTRCSMHLRNTENRSSGQGGRSVLQRDAVVRLCSQPETRAGSHQRHTRTRMPAHQIKPITLHELQRSNSQPGTLYMHLSRPPHTP